MTGANFNNMYCSAKVNDFILLFDGLGTYFLYYQEDLLLEKMEATNPKKLLKDNNLLVPLPEIKENTTNKLILSLLDKITDIIEDTPKNQNLIKRILQGLLTSINNAETDPYQNEEQFKNSKIVLEKAIEISKSAGYDTEVFDELLIPNNIKDEIQLRANPILTDEEKEIANKIAGNIDKIGLLPYLDNILKDIHIGEHKNIYRKILMLFKIMKGDSRFLSETTAKAEAGKSFEDEIVFGLISPQRYIFKVNDITPASFRRYANIDSYYFDRQIIFFGDLGSKKSFKHLEDVFNIFKVLITEKEYKSTLSDKVGDKWENMELHLKVNSIGAVYSTTKTSFTDGDEQLISRTIFSTPASVEDLEIMEHQFYLKYSKSKQSKARAKAEQKLKEFGLYLMQMVNTDIEIINPYIDVFIEYALKSENPKRELNQQLDLFDGYCILTKDKCIRDVKGSYFASLEQLKEYMDYINLENALIPYEYDFLKMIMADGKSNQLTILYDIDPNDNAPGNADNLTLTQCENYAIELMGDDYIGLSKDDLSPNDLKALPYKLIAGYGIRGSSINHKDKVFFRISDLHNIYSKYTAFRNGGDISKLLQSLYKKGYLCKYEFKHSKENLYYLSPLCESILTKFEPKKTYDEYVTNYIANVGYDNL